MHKADINQAVANLGNGDATLFASSAEDRDITSGTSEISNSCCCCF